MRALAAHCIDRYGLAEAFLGRSSKVWNEPNLYKGFWDRTEEDYFKLYAVTAKAIKAVHPGLRVGGPATSDAGAGEAPGRQGFSRVLREREAMPLDFESTHPYPNSWPFDGAGEQIMGYRDENSMLTIWSGTARPWMPQRSAAWKYI